MAKEKINVLLNTSNCNGEHKIGKTPIMTVTGQNSSGEFAVDLCFHCYTPVAWTFPPNFGSVRLTDVLLIDHGKLQFEFRASVNADEFMINIDYEVHR